jgi:hypothetical protein
MEQHVIGATAAIMPGDVTDTETAPRLPPATVGPYSLRLAAAKGDARGPVRGRVAHCRRPRRRQGSQKAFKWMVLASNSGDKEAKSRCDALGAKLNPDELAAATVAIETWRGKRSHPVVNDSRAAAQAWKRPRSTNG